MSNDRAENRAGEAEEAGDEAAWNTFDVRAFRARQRELPEHPYELIASIAQVHDRQRAIDVIELGWEVDNVGRVDVTPPIDWEGLFATHRSRAWRLQAWLHLERVLAVHDRERHEELVDFAVAVALDWTTTYPSSDIASAMAWYDMSVGARSYRLAYVTDRAARDPRFDDGVVAALVGSIRLHQQLLSAESIFAAHSNHGVYVAAGQLAMARRLPTVPGMDAQSTQARRRLRAMLDTQFTPEGVHREHSPGYHRMVLLTLLGLREAGLIDPGTDPEVNAQLDRAEEALAWFVLPSGRLAPIGDTGNGGIGTSLLYRNPALRHVTSRCESGEPPAEVWRAFPESGYVVVRDGWPRQAEEAGRWSYLAVAAAFHSRTHKHADDLSFVWYDRGTELLVDPGRFAYLDPTTADSELGRHGFYYAHPHRVYVEETRAHNAVEIDGASYQRRGVKPPGSLLRRVGVHDGVHVVEARAEHRTMDRSHRIVHRRLLLFAPGQWLVVIDDLVDPSGAAHTYRPWFQFAPGLEVEPDDLGWSALLPDGSATLWGIPLVGGAPSEVFRGQTEPRLQGWVAANDDLLVPAASVHVDAPSADSARIATLFTLGSQAPAPGDTELSAHRSRIEWAHGSWISQLEIASPNDGDITLRRTVGLA